MRLVIKGFGEKVAKCMGMCLPFINASIGSNGLEHIINILPFQWFFREYEKISVNKILL